MTVIFSRLAKLELDDAVLYYELEFPGLGTRFKEEVRKAALRILNYPTACPFECGEIRKYVMHKFPYKLLFSIESDHIFIMAVAHQHRNPDYWVDRL